MAFTPNIQGSRITGSLTGINSISATTYYGDGSNLTGISGGTDTNYYVTGFTYNNSNRLTLSRNGGLSDLTTSINTMSGLTVNGTMFATLVSGTLGAIGTMSTTTLTTNGLTVNSNATINTNLVVTGNTLSNVFSGRTSPAIFYGDGSNLTGIPHTVNTDRFVTGATMDGNTLELSRSGGLGDVTVDLSQFIDDTNYYVTGFTYNDANVFTLSRNGGLGDLTSTINNVTGLTVNGVLSADSITSPSIQITGGVGQEGTFSWNSEDNTVDLNLNDVTLQLGQELHYHVINQTGEQINNGEVVYVVGVSSDKLSVAPYSISMDVDADLVLGVATENIPNTEFGFVTRYGTIRDVNTSGFTVGTVLYALTGSTYTDVTPTPPNHTILLGFVTKEDVTEGSISLKVNHERDADEVKVNLSGSSLTSTNVQAALLELNSKKVNVGVLSSNIILYPTTGTSVVGGGYLRMVTDIDDPDYNTTPVDVSTGTISNLSGQLIASLTSDEGLFIGNPGIINFTTLGNIRKVSGNRDAYFYYELYQRDSGGTETLISTSDNTPNITNTSYEEFFTSSLLNNGIWSSTDRVVIKYYGVKATSGGADPIYEFQFGGDSPVRTLLPVPVSVIPSEDADGIQTDTSNFNNILSGSDTDVQKALDTLDDHSHTLQEVTDEGNITTDRIIIGDLTVDTNTIYTDGSGNVGIGTQTPNTNLTVVGGISATTQMISPLFSGDGITDAIFKGTGPDLHDVTIQQHFLHDGVGSINIGEVVISKGWDVVNNVVTVELADATNGSGRMPAIGIVTQSGDTTTQGLMVSYGYIRGLDTSMYSLSDSIYVSETLGQITNVQPTGDTQIQKLGQVIKVDASDGVIQVVGAGRSNALPQLENNKFWLGNSNWVANQTDVNSLTSKSSPIPNDKIFGWDSVTGTHVNFPWSAVSITSGNNLTGGTGVFAQKTGSNLEFKSFTSTGSTLLITTDDNTINIENASGGGESNTASNVGGGEGVFFQKTGVDLEFKTITSTGSSITVSTIGNTLNFESSAGGGETNTASNLTTTGLFAQKNGVDLEFKGLTSTGGTVTISSDATSVNIESTGGGTGVSDPNKIFSWFMNIT